MNNQNQPLYVLVLNDNGLIQNLTMGMEIAGLADITSRTIREYLEEHGTQHPWDKAPRNESGYANIYHGVPGESNAKVVWTYRFDGEESFEQMDTDLNEVVWAECRRLVEKFLLRNQGRIIKPVDYDCRNGYENELVRSIWDDFENPLLPIALCWLIMSIRLSMTTATHLYLISKPSTALAISFWIKRVTLVRVSDWNRFKNQSLLDR